MTTSTWKPSRRYHATRTSACPLAAPGQRVCQSLIGEADHVTVSNAALQDRFGGTIVPHARDETVFDPSRYDRAAIRHRLGIRADVRLLLFGGTPHEHKGVVELLRAVEELGDDRYRVLMFGTREFDAFRDQIGGLARWAIPLPYQRFADLPSVVVAADLACVLQDPRHPVSRYQLPAKITDTLRDACPMPGPADATHADARRERRPAGGRRRPAAPRAPRGGVREL